MSIKPNVIVINFELVSKSIDYSQTVNELNKKTEILLNDLVSLGFNQDDLKTISYQVNTKYSYVNNQKVFEGYEGIHKLNLKFDYDLNKLFETIDTVSASKAKPSFSVSFEIAEEQAFKDLLVQKAIENAYHNAENITNATNTNILSILKIDYNNDKKVYRSNLVLEDTYLSKSTYIFPDDIKSSEEIVIEFKIE